MKPYSANLYFGPFLAACVLFSQLTASSQPVNDNPCGAISLDVVQTADACTPVIYTMVNPTYLNLSLPDPGSCPGPVTLPSYPDYWFKFTAISTNTRLNFTAEQGSTTGGGVFGTGANYFVVYKASNCNGPFTLVQGCGRTDILYTTKLSGLVINDVYYVRVVSALSDVATSNFGICVSTNKPAATSKVGINVNNPNANLDVAGDVIFRNDLNIQGRVNYYGTSDFSQTGQPDSTYGRSPLLRFSDMAGKKIILGNGLYFDNSYPNGTYGQNALAVGQGTLQLQYPSQYGGGVQFGYGNGLTSFTQTATISGPGNASFGGSLTATGNVGIGLNNPDARFSLTAIGSQLGGTAMSGAFKINAGNLGTNAGDELALASIGLLSANNTALGIRAYRNSPGNSWVTTSLLLCFDVDNTVRAGGSGAFLAINAAGNLGISNANPARPISFPPALGEKIQLYPGANGEVGIGVYGNELRLHCDNPGSKVSFGTQDNAGNFTELAKAQANGSYAFSVFGSIWANGVTYASDARFKENIADIDNPLDKVLKLHGVKYQMKKETFAEQHFDPNQQVGMVAQEVEKIVPEVVSTGPDGFKAIDYAKLVPLLIEAIKTQQLQLDKQEKEIVSLKNRKQKN